MQQYKSFSINKVFSSLQRYADRLFADELHTFPHTKYYVKIKEITF